MSKFNDALDRLSKKGSDYYRATKDLAILREEYDDLLRAFNQQNEIIEDLETTLRTIRTLLEH